MFNSIKGKIILVLCFFIIESCLIMLQVWAGGRIINGTSLMIKAESNFSEFESVSDISFKRYLLTGDKKYYDEFTSYLGPLKILGTLMERFYYHNHNSVQELLDSGLGNLGFQKNDIKDVEFTLGAFRILKGDSLVGLISESKVALDRGSEKADLFKRMLDIQESGMRSQEEVDKINIRMDQLIDASHDINNAFASNASGMEQKIIRLIIGAVTITIVVLTFINLLIVLYITNSITRPIPDMISVSQNVAGGDLSKTIEKRQKPTKDISNITESINNIIVNLRNIILNMKTNSGKVYSLSFNLSASAQEVNSASMEIANSIQEVADGMVVQIERVQETTDLISDMETSVNQVFSNAQSAVEASKQTLACAEIGAEATNETVEKMNNITYTVTEAARMIKILGEKSTQINEISSTISSIAEQTNLLALNAAIEAARAGESGKGFAVVAEEVRKLAEESAEASKEIGILIRAIQEETKNAVSTIQLGSKEVMEGKEIINKLSKAFADINLAIQKTSMSIDEISASSKLQLTGTKQVSDAIHNVAVIAEESSASIQQITSGTQQQTASMQELAASAQDLEQIAGELAEVVERFKM